MQRRKVQRVDGLGLCVDTCDADAASAGEPDQADEPLPPGTVPLVDADMTTSSSWKCKTTGNYDVLKGKLLIESTGDDAGYLSVAVDTKSLYARLGISRKIVDARATAKTIKLLKSEPSTGCSSPSTPNDEPPPPANLLEVARRELQRIAQYGTTLYRTVTNAQKEKTDYKLSCTFKNDVLTLTFTSLETDNVTGARAIAAHDVAALVCKALEVGSDCVDVATLVKQATSGVHAKDAVRIVLGRGRLELEVVLPFDSFTGDATCVARLADLSVI